LPQPELEALSNKFCCSITDAQRLMTCSNCLVGVDALNISGGVASCFQKDCHVIVQQAQEPGRWLAQLVLRWVRMLH
jgi:hypothetical protein